MKYTALLAFLFFFSAAFSQEDYLLRVADSTLSVALGKDYQLLVNGKPIIVSLRAKDTLVFSNKFISFQYANGFTVSQTKLEGVEQTTILSAEGAGIIIQFYTTLNPTSLNEILLNEVTKESVEYGYVLKREDYKKKFASGQEYPVSRAILTYKEDVKQYEFFSLGKKDEGLVVMTLKNSAVKNGPGEKLVEHFWRSLVLKP